MRKKITKRLCKLILFSGLTYFSADMQSQWTGLNPILTGSDVGIGYTNLGATASRITNPLGYLHVSRIEPGVFTLGTILKPQVVIQSWCDGIGEPGSVFGSSQSMFSLDASCYDNSIAITDNNASQMLWSFSRDNTYSPILNLSIGNNFVLTNNDLTLNVPLKGLNCTSPANFESSVDFNAHTYFNEHTFFSKDIQLNNNSAIIFNDATNTTQLKLYGNGNIRAREIKVDLQSIPDYVFKPGYKLMSIADLEKFIAKNKHLPNIKGENEFNEAEGISLGEMNLKLLEKVEELTLYTIQQQKEIDELKKTVSTFVKK